MIFDGGREGWEEADDVPVRIVMRGLLFIALVALLLAVFAGWAYACGTERWPVKTATDQDTASIDASPMLSTIATLRGYTAPINPDGRRDTRFAPTETGVVTLQGELVLIKHEADQDYHLVIADQNNPRATMIVEAPDPRCATGSRFTREITKVRIAIDAHFGGPVTRKQGSLTSPLMIPVTVIGVPFFDKLHGQEGVSPNGIELHPILGIQFSN